MSVYLGTFGKVELQRQFDGSELNSTINTDDVNTTARRFSFDFERGQLITGDQIEIKSTDGSALDFINGYTDSSAKRFIHVNELGGIRLYSSFADAVNGGRTNALVLATPGNAIPISVTVENNIARLLAQVNSYELNTERETVDTTTLSDDFRSRISTLVSGSGRMSCFWEYTGDTVKELPNYLIELSLRTKVGSQFHAKFYLKANGYTPDGSALNQIDDIFYEFDAVITACAVQFSPDAAVQITADFITTGAVELKIDTFVGEAVLQEDASDILLDQDGAAKLLLETDL
jgi:hypothetical protein